MGKIKFFNSNSLNELEKEINSWIAGNPTFDILQIAQSESRVGQGADQSRSYTLALFYDEPDKKTDKPVTRDEIKKLEEEVRKLEKEVHS